MLGALAVPGGSTRMKRAALVIAVPLALTGCPKEKQLTSSEARMALEEAGASSSAENLMSASVDISTNFTIGQAVENAAAELQTFIASQLPCADVSLAGA